MAVRFVILVFILSLCGCVRSGVVSDSDLIYKYKRSLVGVSEINPKEITRVVKDKPTAFYDVGKGQQYNVELRGVLVGDFADMIFSKVLKVPYVIDQSVKSSSRGVDIVVNQKISKDQLYKVAVRALERVGYWVELDHGVVFIYNRDDSEKKSGRVVYDVVLSNVTSSDIIDEVSKHIANNEEVKISGDYRRNLVISGEYYAARRLSEVAVILDKEQKRIRFEVEIYEMNITGALRFGFEGFINKVLGNFALNVASPVVDVSSFYYSSLSYGNEFKYLVNMMKKDGVLRSVARPFLYCTDSKSCKFEVGQRIPILQSERVSDEGTSTVNQMAYYNTGVKVDLYPVVISNDDLIIEVLIETSKGSNNNLSAIDSPIIINRKLETEIRSKSSVPLVIAGIIYDQKESIYSGLPVEYGWFGFLKNRSVDEMKTELVIIITPYIVKDSEVESVNEKLLDAVRSLK